jgi:hypothetical protein
MEGKLPITGEQMRQYSYKTIKQTPYQHKRKEMAAVVSCKVAQEKSNEGKESYVRGYSGAYIWP